jgi:anti-sigma-K factor RskA
MMMEEREPDEIEALLPWHAAGTLSRDDAARVEAALARDHELARRYALVREELAETIRLNEALGAPSPRPLQRLMTQIDVEAADSARRRGQVAIGRWLEGLLLRLSPRALAWSAVAAAVVILVQAGFLAALFVGPQGHSYRTASVEQAAATPGAYALVGFVPQASAADVTKLLETYKASIVDGPRAGDLYRIRIGQAGLSRDELSGIVGRLRGESNVVRFAVPAE